VGEVVDGVMQADNETAVIRTLDERELFPINVSERRPKRSSMLRGGRIRMRDVGVMYGQLADLLRAGVPMIRALETISRASSNRRLAEIVRRVRDEVSEGKTLADALGNHPRAFAPLHSAMVHAGERGGFLEDVLANLADYIDRQDDLRSKVRGAMIYPLVLSIIGVVVISALLILIVPQFKSLFEGVPVPLPSLILFAASDLLTDQWPVLLAVIFLVAIALAAFKSSHAGRRAWDLLRLKTPLLGRVTRNVSVSRFCRILGTMLNNGVPILQALSISKDSTDLTVMSEQVERATENVRAGEKLADPLKAGDLFPPEVIEMIAVAEESNQLEKVLIQIADTVERRTNRLVDAAVRLIEPLILVVIAGMIGFMAMGILYPIFIMARQLG